MRDASMMNVCPAPGTAQDSGAGSRGPVPKKDGRSANWSYTLTTVL